MKSGNLNLLEPSGPLQACNGTAFVLPHRMPASARISRDSCSVQGHDRREIRAKMIDQ